MSTQELRDRVIDLVAKTLQVPAQSLGPEDASARTGR
jgi:hypothetical protein